MLRILLIAIVQLLSGQLLPSQCWSRPSGPAPKRPAPASGRYCGRRWPRNRIDHALALPLQKLARVIAGVLVGVGAVGVEHVLHIGVVPALNKAAGVLCVVLHRDNAAALHQNGDVFLPAVAEGGCAQRICR